MTVRAKTLVKDKFWIVEQNGQKLGTLQKQEDNGWIFLSKLKNREVFHTQESLFTKFGFGIFDESNIKKPEEEVQTDNFDVHGYPCTSKLSVCISSSGFLIFDSSNIPNPNFVNRLSCVWNTCLLSFLLRNTQPLSICFCRVPNFWPFCSTIQNLSLTKVFALIVMIPTSH